MRSSSRELSAEERRKLLDLARQSIRFGLEHGRPLRPDPDLYPGPLWASAATFVTLKQHGDLRGCIGTLEPHQPLAMDVAEHAYAAAFRDPRFAPVTRAEIDGLEISVSVLSEAEELSFSDERDLLDQLHPRTDGLILEAGSRRGTFLPSVWSSLPNPSEFLAQLKLKAGLPADFWSPSIRVWRYTTEEFGDVRGSRDAS